MGLPAASSEPVASLWLLAATADEVALIDDVRQLSARHGTPAFHPHLTVLGDIPAHPDRLLARSAAVAAAVPPFAASVEAVVTSDSYFRSFYAGFPLVAELAALRAAAVSAFGIEPGPFTPHVSLLYGPVAPGPKAESAAEASRRWQGRRIRFDRLAITNSGNDVPIADWRCLHVLPLAG